MCESVDISKVEYDLQLQKLGYKFMIWTKDNLVKLTLIHLRIV